MTRTGHHPDCCAERGCHPNVCSHGTVLPDGTLRCEPDKCKVCGESAEDGPVGSDGKAVCGDCYAEWKAQGYPA